MSLSSLLLFDPMIISGQREDLIKGCNERAKNARVEFGLGK
jgi:hypothetical protein